MGQGQGQYSEERRRVAQTGNLSVERKEWHGTDARTQSLASLLHWGDLKLGSVDQIHLPPELYRHRDKESPEMLPGRLEAALLTPAVTPMVRAEDGGLSGPG